MKNAWMQVVRAKVSGQALNLPPGTCRDKIQSLLPRIRSGDPDNIEARAARTYWSCMFTGEAFRRAPDGDGRNSLLNYGYAVLRGMMLRSIVAAGLSPTLGIFHRNRANAFALVDDLVEPYRPAVDHAVGGMLPTARLEDSPTKRALVAVLQEPMRTFGPTVLSSMTELAQQYARYAEGEVEKLVVAHWVPPDG